MLAAERCVLSLYYYIVAGFLVATVLSLKKPTDIILQAKCNAVCYGQNHNHHHNQCVKSCVSNGWKEKPGHCPKEGEPHTLACIQECSSDRQCHGVDKCCPHTCGITCKSPYDLLTLKGLPQVPNDIRLTERKRSNVVIITWSPSSIDGVKTLYLVQERHTPGQIYRGETMGQWRLAHKAPKFKPKAKLTLKRGNWYQIRIAAISANGTRGFSQPTQQFILSQSPGPPPPPTELMFTRTTRKNGTVSGILSWEPPFDNDIPLLRYNVLWSKRPTAVFSVLKPYNQEAVVFTQTKRVSSDRASIKIKNLSVHSVYDFQVEAVSQYGKEKLISERANLTYNVTDTGKIFKRPRGERKLRPMAIQLSKPILQDGKLTYKISWKARPSKPYDKYALTWTSDCGQAKTIKNVVTEGWHYELSGLKFSCKYNVYVREKLFGRKSKRGGRIMFTSASCNEFDPPAC